MSAGPVEFAALTGALQWGAPCPTPPPAPVSRPTLTGEEHAVDSDDGRFTVHYTTEGDDRIPTEDEDGNGVPDVVDRVLWALDYGADEFESVEGYRPLNLDGGEDGGDAIDLYMTEISKNGFATVVDTDEGASCFMRIHPKLIDMGTEVLESVVIHELHHCVQYAYTTDAADWMYEATATAEQYRLITNTTLQAAVDLLYYTRLQHPDRPLGNKEGNFEYSGFVFAKFWEDVLEEGTPLPDLWEALADDADWKVAVDVEAERRWGGDLAEAFLTYAIWNGFACTRDDGAHYDASWAPCTIETSVPVEALDATELVIVHEDAPFVTSYGEWMPEGDARPIELTCEVDVGEAAVGLISLDSSGIAREVATATSNDGVRMVALEDALDLEGSVLAVFASTGDDPLELRCEVDRGDLPPEADNSDPPKKAGCGCGQSSALGGWGWLAVVLSGVIGRIRTAARS